MVALVCFFFLFFCVLFTLNNSTRGEWGQIKINEPRTSYSSNNNNNNDNNNDNNNNNNNNAYASSSYRDPHSETENNEIVIPSVIEYLTSRKGDTIEGTHDQYTYKVCLFEKVEQSENVYNWNLGVFDKWDYCDPNIQNELCLIYTDGQVCGNGIGRSSHVHIICAESIVDRDPTKEHLFDITEPLTCSYHMKMYIPQICELVNDNINNVFVDAIHTNNNADIQPQIESIVVGMDTSGIMNKLNEIVDKQNEEKELDHLWKLCLMSLMVDDENKLNKIKNVANIFISKTNDVHVEYTGVCDFYLQQMLQNNKRQTDPPLPPNNNDEDIIVETTVVSVGDDVIEVISDIDNEEIDNKMGGLIGAISNEDINDVENDVENDAVRGNDDDVVLNEFQGDKIVFQSGVNQEDQQNDIIHDIDDEEKVVEADVGSNIEHDL